MNPQGPFLCEYSHNGSRYTCLIGGNSWAEADQHRASISASGRIIGSNVSRVPVNAFTLPFARLFVNVTIWLKNLFRAGS